MPRSVADLGLIVAPYPLSRRVCIVVHLYFRLVIRVDNNPTRALRNGNIAGQEVPEPCLVRVLVCMNEDCHREIVLPCLVGAERRGRTRGRLTLQTIAK